MHDNEGTSCLSVSLRSVRMEARYCPRVSFPELPWVVLPDIVIPPKLSPLPEL